jgi:hypothetical protein
MPAKIEKNEKNEVIKITFTKYDKSRKVYILHDNDSANLSHLHDAIKAKMGIKMPSRITRKVETMRKEYQKHIEHKNALLADMKEHKKAYSVFGIICDDSSKRFVKSWDYLVDYLTTNKPAKVKSLNRAIANAYQMEESDKRRAESLAQREALRIAHANANVTK